MTPKIVEATEVQFEEVPAVEEPRNILEEKPANNPILEHGQDGSITLPDIILYDSRGHPWHKYKSVTLHPASRKGDGKYFTTYQDKWIARAKEEGKEIPSLPLFYAIIEKLHTEKHPAEANLLAQLKTGVFCTSTRLGYHTNMIIQELGFLNQYCSVLKKIPESSWSEYIKEKKEEATWRDFLQELIQPRDIDQAIELLREFSGHPADVWTINPNTSEDPRKAVVLYGSSQSLTLDCRCALDNPTYSRMVTLNGYSRIVRI